MGAGGQHGTLCDEENLGTLVVIKKFRQQVLRASSTKEVNKGIRNEEFAREVNKESIYGAKCIRGESLDKVSMELFISEP